jgi:hypothetical protein
MIVRSKFLTEGLFGQVFAWMLEVLPHIDAQGWKPEWEILTRNYGAPPSFNIFPTIVGAKYEPSESTDVVSFEKLQRNHKHNFRYDFKSANKAWNAHFHFSNDVYDRLHSCWQKNFDGRIVLGVHYRGTDKNVDPYETNPVTQYQFICIIEDFLKSHPDVDAIFVASDDARFVDAMSRFRNVFSYEQNRSIDDTPLHLNHCTDRNQAMAKDAILDCLTLAKCRYGLKCMSQLSAFSKIMNPALEIYRVSACKPGWFPDAYVPRFQSDSRAVQALLNVIQQDDYHSTLYEKATGIHRQVQRISRQAWQKRNALRLFGDGRS